MNYFDLYDFQEQFVIDQVALKKKYYSLSKQYHPDFTGAENEAENLLISAAVNNGYTLFQNVDATMGYLLKLKGVVVEEEKYALSPDFLMEVMDLNEDVDEKTIPAIHTLENELYNEIKKTVEEKAIQDFTKADYDLIKDYYYKKKYLNRLLQRAKGVVEGLD
jgi:molecular chaperone HscB